MNQGHQQGGIQNPINLDSDNEDTLEVDTAEFTDSDIYIDSEDIISDSDSDQQSRISVSSDYGDGDNSDDSDYNDTSY